MPNVTYSLYKGAQPYGFLGKPLISSIQAIKELIFLKHDAVALVFPYNYN